jgi:hypothetical protein
MKLTATTRGSWISEGMASIAAIGKVERRGRLVLVAIFCYVAVVEKVVMQEKLANPLPINLKFSSSSRDIERPQKMSPLQKRRPTDEL